MLFTHPKIFVTWLEHTRTTIKGLPEAKFNSTSKQMPSLPVYMLLVRMIHLPMPNKPLTPHPTSYLQLQSPPGRVPASLLWSCCCCNYPSACSSRSICPWHHTAIPTNKPHIPLSAISPLPLLVACTAALVLCYCCYAYTYCSTSLFFVTA